MEYISSVIDEKQPLLDKTADFLWDHPETAFTEFQSAAYLCQVLREHIPMICRIHYAITNAGGLSPNVVQPHAEVNYCIRAIDNKTVAEVYHRVSEVARGAAIMTGTPGHSWQQTAMSKSSYAKKMTGYAAKVLAAGAVELLNDPALLEKAKAEHRKKVGPEGYVPPIPKDISPVSVYNH